MDADAPDFFLGTDSAPHSQSAKESSCGCAGMFSAYSAIELYAEAFEAVDALDKLEAFASFYGADFYGLPRNEEKVTLIGASDGTNVSIQAAAKLKEYGLVVDIISINGPAFSGEDDPSDCKVDAILLMLVKDRVEI